MKRKADEALENLGEEIFLQEMKRALRTADEEKKAEAEEPVHEVNPL